MIYPYILRQSGPKTFRNLINKTETMPDPLPVLDPDTDEPVTDRAKNERYKLLKDYLDKVDKFSQVIDDVTSGTSCAPTIEPFLADVEAIQNFLQDNSGRTILKAVEKCLEQHVIPNTNSLLSDFETAVLLVDRAKTILAQNGYNMDDADQALHLRDLLIKLPRFEPIFFAG